MKTPAVLLPLLLALLPLAGCAPQALYFHESTKVSFSAAYTSSDSEPLSTSFGYKRRILAIVPGQARVSPTGAKGDAENSGEALSTISKFYVKAGTRDGLIIRNNFATGLAARRLLKEPTSAAVAVAGLMHGIPVITDATGEVVDAEGLPITGRSGAPVTVTDVAAQRVAKVKSKMIGAGKAAPQKEEFRQRASKVLFRKNGETWVRETSPDGRVVEYPLKKSGGDKKAAEETKKPDPITPGPLPDDPLDGPAAAEIFKDPVTGKTMKRITKPDGTTELVPLR